MIWTTDYSLSTLLYCVVEWEKTHTYCPIDPSLEIVLCPFCPHPFKWPIASLHPLVSCRLYPSGSNKNFHSICKGKNWEWSLQCTASVSSGSESNHTKTVAARQRTCLSLPPVSCTVGERKKTMQAESQWGGLSQAAPPVLCEWTLSRPTKQSPTKTVCDIKSDGPCVTSQSKSWTCALFTVTWRRHPHHEVAGWVEDRTFRF